MAAVDLKYGAALSDISEHRSKHESDFTNKGFSSGGSVIQGGFVCGVRTRVSDHVTMVVRQYADAAYEARDLGSCSLIRDFENVSASHRCHRILLGLEMRV